MQLIKKDVIRNIDSVPNGFKKVCELTGMEGRWQKIHNEPTAICDTGHNTGGWKYLSEQIKKQPNEVKRLVFGMVDDKDLDGVMDMLPKDAIYYFTQPQCKRAFSVKKIAAEGE